MHHFHACFCHFSLCTHEKNATFAPTTGSLVKPITALGNLNLAT